MGTSNERWRTSSHTCPGSSGAGRGQRGDIQAVPGRLGVCRLAIGGPRHLPRNKTAAPARFCRPRVPLDITKLVPSHDVQRSCRSQAQRSVLARTGIQENVAVSLGRVFVARLPSAPEKQPQRLEGLPLKFPGTSTQALGERTVCIEPARSNRV
jgi:hypothetical protein